MRIAALALVLLAAPQEGAITLERSVRLTLVDTLNRRREIHRKERVSIKGGNLAVIDLTFGERLIVRTDQKKILRIDGPGGAYSEYTFEEAAAIRKAALDEIAAAKARVPGTPDEKELESLLEGYDRFAKPPTAELKSSNSDRQVLVNGDRVRLSAQVDEKVKSPGPLAALSAAGAFPPEVAGKLGELGGLPLKGTVRYVLFLDRVVEEFEVTSVKAGEAADADFELPPGLAKVPLRGFERAPDRPPEGPKKDGKK
jgi:hypothetical protein